MKMYTLKNSSVAKLSLIDSSKYRIVSYFKSMMNSSRAALSKEELELFEIKFMTYDCSTEEHIKFVQDIFIKFRVLVEEMLRDS